MAISNLGMSQLFQAPRPIAQPYPHTHGFVSKIKPTPACVLEDTRAVLHPATCSGWLCRRPGLSTDLLRQGTSPSQRHPHKDRQHTVPRVCKLSCWLCSAHREEGKIMRNYTKADMISTIVKLLWKNLYGV